MSELENIVPGPTAPNLASESVQNLIPPKKKFPFLLYISLILLSVLSVISIYLFLQVRQLTLEKLAPSPTPIPSPSADPTAGWQTYTYKDITFKYPIDWNITTDNMIAVQPPYKGDQEEYPAITFFAIDNPKNLTVQEYDEQVSKEGMDPALYSAFIGESEVIAQAKSFNGIESYTLNDQNCEPLGCDKFSFVLNKKIYVIQNVFDHQTLPMEGSVDDKEDMRIVFNQILSTLKFTDYAASPSINSPKANAIIRSPLNITGSVPTGWMFEGQFPIEIRDSENRVVGSGIAHEVSPGSWSSGKSVDFSAKVDFSPTAKSGFIFLLSDNPSGIPEKQLTFKLPVNF